MFNKKLPTLIGNFLVYFLRTSGGTTPIKLVISTSKDNVLYIQSNGLFQDYALGGSAYVLSGDLTGTLAVNCYGAAAVTLTGEVE